MHEYCHYSVPTDLQYTVTPQVIMAYYNDAPFDSPLVEDIDDYSDVSSGLQSGVTPTSRSGSQSNYTAARYLPFRPRYKNGFCSQPPRFFNTPPSHMRGAGSVWYPPHEEMYESLLDSQTRCWRREWTSGSRQLQG